MSCAFHPGGAVVADGFLVGFTNHPKEFGCEEKSPLKEIAEIVYAAKAERPNWPLNDDGTRWMLHPMPAFNGLEPWRKRLAVIGLTSVVQWDDLLLLAQDFEQGLETSRRSGGVEGFFRAQREQREQILQLTAERDELLKRVTQTAKLSMPGVLVIEGAHLNKGAAALVSGDQVLAVDGIGEEQKEGES